MNGKNSLDEPTINGLKSLTLDEIDTNILNAGTIFLNNLETENIIIDNFLLMQNGSSILANSTNISDVEISYLDGLNANVQEQIEDIVDDINSLEIKTQNITAIAGETTFTGTINLNSGSNIVSNGLSITDVEISYLDGLDSNIQEQIDLLPDMDDVTDLIDKTQNISVSANVTQFDNAILTDEIYLNSGGFIDFVDDRQYDAYTSVDKTKVTVLNINSTEMTINQIKFTDDVGSSAVQRTAFTSFLRSLIITNGTNISNLQDKTANITRGGSITNISGALTTPIVSIGTQINFPDTSVQTTAYIPTSPVLTQYSGDALICLGQVINSAGTWYNFNYTWQPTAIFLTPGMYTINLMMTLGKINELQRIESYMFITRFGATVEESFESGIYLQSATGQREKYNYNLQFIYKSEHSTNLLNVYTAIHMKASSLSYFLGKVQILKH